MGESTTAGTPNPTTPVANNDTVPSAEDIAGVIAELEQYRARLIEDFTTTAKKAKLPKSMAMSQLKTHPEILKIDAALAQLRGEPQVVDESTAQSGVEH